MNKQWKSAHRVIEMLEAQGFEAVIVGGAVRDYLLDRPFNDVDVATNALPEQVKDVFSNTVDVGIQHGTILVLDGGEPIEVTTYRAESEYIDFRRPEQVFFVRDLSEDLKRRDFTINAIALRASGELVDLYGGQRDLQAKVIRAVGDASERFQEDALRMLRAIRFQAQLGFTIEVETFAALQANAALIEHIAMERIAQELTKVFTGNFTAQGIKAILSSGLSEHLPGTFDGACWQIVKIDTAEQGWAYFYCLNAAHDGHILSAYKCSNKLKAYAKSVEELVQLDVWDEVTYFDYELESLLFAGRVLNALGKSKVRETDIVKAKEGLVIQSFQELAVTGKDIVEWSSGKKGPWIKERLNSLKRAVLSGEVTNDRTHIKGWYDAKFNEG